MDMAKVRRAFAYGGALSITPYLVIKVCWVIGALLGLLPVDPGFTLASWVALNIVTIVLASGGIVLCLAMAQPWGARVPAAPVLTFAWVGAGFLVSMMPYLLVTSVLGGSGEGRATQDTGPGMPAWEAGLIEVSFAGLALGIAVALPLYLRARWPVAFVGRLRERPATPLSARGRAAVVAAAAVAVVDVYWTVGGTLGLDHPDARATDWRLMSATTAIWAGTAAWSAWAMSRSRPGRLPVWVPFLATWVGSGMLFAWSAWKLPFTAYLATTPDAEVVWPEDLGVVAVRFTIGLVAGLLLLSAALETYRSRSALTPSPLPRALHHAGTSAGRPGTARSG
ncbi:hypothetical protein [Cellulomonas sp. URHD0024]|uniref:hypothetical protein n=1 Tax=Cellulomonas sp. URHD0024 TaxID=1302620 RepID=UPI0006878F8D|nr:hypothetical protein [Cellulomonas sp. URHD0024]